MRVDWLGAIRERGQEAPVASLLPPTRVRPLVAGNTEANPEAPPTRDQEMFTVLAHSVYTEHSASIHRKECTGIAAEARRKESTAYDYDSIEQARLEFYDDCENPAAEFDESCFIHRCAQ